MTRQRKILGRSYLGDVALFFELASDSISDDFSPNLAIYSHRNARVDTHQTVTRRHARVGTRMHYPPSCSGKFLAGNARALPFVSFVARARVQINRQKKDRKNAREESGGGSAFVIYSAPRYKPSLRAIAIASLTHR